MRAPKHIASGNTADIFLDSGIVRKVYRGHSRSAVEEEARNQKFAWQAGLPVPRVIGIEESESSIVLSMDHLPGESMLAHIEREPHRLEELLRASVELQITVHNSPAIELRQMSNRLHQQIQSVSGIGDNRKAKILYQLQSIGNETRLCHGDFHVQNILVSDSILAIIDWMDATRGNPLLDVCRSYLLYLGVDEAFAEMYLAEYCQQSGANPEVVTRWLPLMAAARLSEHIGTDEQDRLMFLVQINS